MSQNHVQKNEAFSIRVQSVAPIDSFVSSANLEYSPVRIFCTKSTRFVVCVKLLFLLRSHLKERAMLQALPANLLNAFLQATIIPPLRARTAEALQEDMKIAPKKVIRSLRAIKCHSCSTPMQNIGCRAIRCRTDSSYTTSNLRHVVVMDKNRSCWYGIIRALPARNERSNLFG